MLKATSAPRLTLLPARPGWALNKPKPLRRSSPAGVGQGVQMFKASPLFFRVFFSGDYLCAADVATTLPASAWHVLGSALAEISGFRTHKLVAIFVVVADVKGMTAGVRD